MQCQTYHFVIRKRSGFTIIELIVSIAVIGLLLSLLLPAVQQVRSTSRKMQCSNNLHQIGVTVHHIHDVKGAFPSSGFAREIVSFLNPGVTITNTTYVHTTPEEVAEEEAFRAASTPYFACPSDPVESITHGRALNYFLNLGTGYGNFDDGFVKAHGQVSARDVTDGLSQTVMFSEKLIYLGAKRNLIGNGPFAPTPDQKMRRLARTNAYYDPDQIDVFADACANSPTWCGGRAGRVCSWLSSGCGDLSYNHILPPNNNSCYNGVPDRTSTPQRYAALTANSLHYGGVNALLGDGSVRFISDSIDRYVWRALGTRNGGEANANSAF